MCTTKNKKTLQKYLLCTPLSTKSIHYFNLELVYLLFGLIRLYLMVDCCIPWNMTFVSVLAQIYVKKQKHLVDSCCIPSPFSLLIWWLVGGFRALWGSHFCWYLYVWLVEKRLPSCHCQNKRRRETAAALSRKRVGGFVPFEWNKLTLIS